MSYVQRAHAFDLKRASPRRGPRGTQLKPEGRLLGRRPNRFGHLGHAIRLDPNRASRCSDCLAMGLVEGWQPIEMEAFAAYRLHPSAGHWPRGVTRLSQRYSPQSRHFPFHPHTPPFQSKHPVTRPGSASDFRTPVHSSSIAHQSSRVEHGVGSAVVE